MAQGRPQLNHLAAAAAAAAVISLENPEKISGVLTLVVEEADFAGDVEKQLKDYRKKANVPGFRPGQAPMGMIKRQIGAQVKVDVINRLVGEKLYEYVHENKIGRASCRERVSPRV